MSDPGQTRAAKTPLCFLLILLFAIVGQACAPRRPPGTLKALLDSERPGATTGAARHLRALATATVSHQGTLDVALVAARPDRLRIEFLDALGRPMAVVGCDGTRVWAVETGRPGVGLGGTSAAEMERVLGLAMGPADLLELLLGGAPGDGWEDWAMARFGPRDRIKMKLPRGEPGGGVMLLAIDPLRVVERRWSSADVRAIYSAFEDLAGIHFPGQIEIRTRGGAVQLRYDAIDLESEPPDTAFVVPGEGPVFDLGEWSGGLIGLGGAGWTE